VLSPSFSAIFDGQSGEEWGLAKVFFAAADRSCVAVSIPDSDGGALGGRGMDFATQVPPLPNGRYSNVKRIPKKASACGATAGSSRESPLMT